MCSLLIRSFLSSTHPECRENMKIQPLQGVIFDVDGTTLDSKKAQYEWLCYAAERFGGNACVPQNDAAFWQDYNRHYQEKGMPGLYDMIGVDFHAHRDEIWAEYNKYNQEHPAPAVPGIEGVIKAIFAKSRVSLSRPTALRLGMNTTKTWADIEPALKNADLVQYFDTIVTKDDIYNYATDGMARKRRIPFDDIEALRMLLPENVVKELEKPASLCSWLAVQRLNVDPASVIAFEDTAGGIQSYKSVLMPRRRIDIYTVGVTWGFEDKDALVAAGADEIAEHPVQLMDVVEKLGGFS